MQLTMVDEFKSLKDTLLKSVFTTVVGGADGDRQSPSALRELISTLASIAGKGKDEMVQIISREIGIAVAGVVKEPLRQVLEDSRMKITIELVPKSEDTTAAKKTKKQKAPNNRPT
jgi:hypothetical protein